MHFRLCLIVILSGIGTRVPAFGQVSCDELRDSSGFWREDPDPDDCLWPLAGMAPEGWERDTTPTLWYEPQTGILQLVGARAEKTNVGMTSVFLVAKPAVFRDDVSKGDVAALRGPFDAIGPDFISTQSFSAPIVDIDFGQVMLRNLDAVDILQSLQTSRSIAPEFLDVADFSDGYSPPWDLKISPPGTLPPLDSEIDSTIRTPGQLQPGDADRDFDFDQFDLVRVLAAGKYFTGQAATWGEGDWDGGPGEQGDPPIGDLEFNQLDVVNAIRSGIYLSGKYDDGGRQGLSSAPISCCGLENDERPSLIYNADTGELAIEVPAGQQLNSINIESATGILNEDSQSIRQLLDGAFDFNDGHTIFKSTFLSSFGSISFGAVARPDLSPSFLLADLSGIGSFDGGGMLNSLDLVYRGIIPQILPGDANQDLQFDQLDIVQVVQAEKYLTGLPATWGEGDWNGAPGGSPGNPPAGDGLFNQLDIVAALDGGVYLTGAYAVEQGGAEGDEQTSLVYDAGSGELRVDAPASRNLTSINITSAGSMFTGDRPDALVDAFDNFAPDNIFKATFGGSFGDISFGAVLPIGLSEADVAADLTVIGSLDGGGELGSVDLVYLAVPEPSAMLAILVAAPYLAFFLAKML